MTARPPIAILYGQPEQFSTSFQTAQFAAALERWFSPVHLPIRSRSNRGWLVQWRRFNSNYLRPRMVRPEFPFIFYGNDGLVDFRFWPGKRILYWYDAPADWSKTTPSWRHWVQRIRCANVKVADAVFCVSQRQVEVAKRLRPGGEAVVQYLPVGVNCDWFDPAKARGDWTRHEFHLPQKIIIGYLGYLASLAGRFAGQQLAEIAPSLTAMLPVHFLVVGFGPALATFRRTIEALRVQDHFTFTGYIPNERLPDAIASMDICIDTLEPGFHSEARSETKLKQYMAMGRACIATAIGENRVDLDEGRCGLLVVPGEKPLAAAIAELCGDAARRNDLGGRARDRAVAVYDWRRLAERFAEALGLDSCEQQNIPAPN